MLKRIHPTRAELFVHAENLLAKRVVLTTEVARHAAECEACRSEISSIRASLDLIRSTPALEPARDVKASVLLAAKAELRGDRLRSGFGPLRTFATGLAVAACLLLVLGTVLHGATRSLPEGGNATALGTGSAQVMTAGFSLDTLQQATAEEKLLGSALRSTVWSPRNAWERAQWRALTTIDDDIEEALEALKNNPALVRASRVVSTNRERKKETLKALYANRNL